MRRSEFVQKINNVGQTHIDSVAKQFADTIRFKMSNVNYKASQYAFESTLYVDHQVYTSVGGTELLEIIKILHNLFSDWGLNKSFVIKRNNTSNYDDGDTYYFNCVATFSIKD